jgi:hypothetical protein
MTSYRNPIELAEKAGRPRAIFGWKFFYCSLLSLAVVIVWLYRDAVQWDLVIWYQLVSGLMLCVAGSAVAGLGMATFLSSKKAIEMQKPDAGPGTPSGTTAGVNPTLRPGGEAKSEDEPDASRPLKSTDSLRRVPGIGRERAAFAATFRIRTIDDLVSAGPEVQEILKARFTTSVFEAALQAAKAAAHQG